MRNNYLQIKRISNIKQTYEINIHIINTQIIIKTNY